MDVEGQAQARLWSFALHCSVRLLNPALETAVREYFSSAEEPAAVFSTQGERARQGRAAVVLRGPRARCRPRPSRQGAPGQSCRKPSRTSQVTGVRPGWRVPALGEAPRPRARSLHVARSSRCPGQPPLRPVSRPQLVPALHHHAVSQTSHCCRVAPSPPSGTVFVSPGLCQAGHCEGTGPPRRAGFLPLPPHVLGSSSVLSALGPRLRLCRAPPAVRVPTPRSPGLRFAFSEVVLSRRGLATSFASFPWPPAAATLS